MDRDNDKELQELAAIEQDVLSTSKSMDPLSNPFKQCGLYEDGPQRATFASNAPMRHSCPSFGTRGLVPAPERPSNPMTKDTQWLRMQEDSTESGDESCLEQVTSAIPVEDLNNPWQFCDYRHSFGDTSTQL